MTSSTHITFSTLPTPASLQPRSSVSSSTTTRSPSPYPDQKLLFPNPAVSVISAVSHHAKRTCKQLVSIRGRRGGQEKTPNMAKMRLVTPVYDHELGRWVWPDSILEDGEDEAVDDEDSRGRSRGTSFASSRTSTSSR